MTLLELWHLCKKSWYLLIVFPLIFGVGAAGYCWGFIPDEYTASVNLYVLSKADNGKDFATSSDMQASQQMANDLAVLIETNRVTSAAAKDLGMTSLDGFKVGVSSATTNRVVTISVTSGKAESSAMVADALAKQAADAAVDVMDLQAVNIFDKAEIPSSPSGPNRSLYTMAAVLVGLFVALALIVMRDMFDTTIRSDEDLEETLGYPVLGVLPNVGKDA